MSNAITEGLHHLGFTVSDLSLAQDFFINALGFEVLGEDPGYPAVFVSDSVTMITLWAANPDARPFDRHNQIGLHHAAFAIENMAQLESLQAKLKQWPNVTFDSEISPMLPGSPAMHFLIRMPGGPRIEFVYPGA